MRGITRDAGLSTAVVAAVALVSGAARVALADSLSTTSSLCDITINEATGSPVNHVFMYGSSPTNSNGLYVAWGYGPTTWAWGIYFGPQLRSTQLACAAFDDQALVMYRDTSNNLRSRDRLSSWTEVLLPGGSSSSGQGLWAMTVMDGGRKKIVLFAVQGTNAMSMWVWDQTATPKWSGPTSLGTVPGGVTTTSEHRLTGYGYALGDAPFTATVSVVVVTSDGHLRENKGPLVGARSWIDHGLAPGNKAFSPIIGFGPSAVSWAGMGHPGPLTEGDYRRRITVPLADQTGVYTRFASGTSPWAWQQIASSTTTPSMALNLNGGIYHPCGFGSCEPGTGTVGVFSIGGGTFRFGYHQSANQSSGSWTTLSPTATIGTNPALIRFGGLDNEFVFVQSSTNLALFDFGTLAITNLGHP